MEDRKLYIVMVGLPARGKSTTSLRLRDTFSRSDIPTRIFNNGNLRRQYLKGGQSYAAEFYNPANLEGVELRRKFALTNLKRAKTFLRGKGELAIIDAANVSAERRQMIESVLDDHPVLYIECRNNDEEILYLSMLQKIRTPEFQHMSASSAMQEFTSRVRYYEQIYEPLASERNYILVDSLFNRIIKEKIEDQIPRYSRIRDFLVTDTVKNLFLVRHGQTFYNVEDRIGGDSLLTPKGHNQAQALSRYFSGKRIANIFTSQKLRTIQTAEPICQAQQNCTIVSLGEFNEIDSGTCEELTYREIQEQMPAVHMASKADKYHYVYPEGEGYVSMQHRIEVGLKKAFFLNRNADNMMIVGHRAVNRMILAHFLYRREEDVPHIYVPQDRFYHIVSTQNKRLLELKHFGL